MVAALPAYAKISELRLCIKAPSLEATRPLNLKAPYDNPFREMWAGEIVLADMSIDNALAFQGWAESLDGRVTPFSVQLKEGVYSQTCSASATLFAAPSIGADRLALNVAGGSIRKGTLLTIGNIDAREYQMFEALETVAAGECVPLAIAPRIGFAFDITAQVAVGDVSAKLTLATDELEASLRLSKGVAVLSVREALNA